MSPMFGSSDPREVIRSGIEFLASQQPLAKLDLTTIRFLKARYLANYQVQYVVLQDIKGQSWRFSFLLTKLHSLWFVKTSAGGPEMVPVEPPELHGHPWIQLETLVIANEFYAFGEVFNKGYPVVCVRLLDPGGLMLEDNLQDDIVLFWSEQLPTHPLQLELYDDSGTLVSRQKVSL